MNQKEQFDQLYRNLNPEQKKAVDTIEGPVLVIAGPGTGKTQILGARIGKILLETDTDAGNILCLTYTDAGAIAMRRRLISMIGPEAYKVNIFTFHAFCNDIIQENLPYFERNSLEPISELEQIQLLRQLIDQFPAKHPLKRFRSDAYYEVRNLRSLFSTMKREGYTAAFIEERIDQYLADLPNREKYVYKKAVSGFKKGDLKKAELDLEHNRMEKLRAAVQEFNRYQHLMLEKGRYDYDDMINWVIRAFEENEDLLRRYQEKYQYILVDEYQDTSGTQNRIVELLINFWSSPNIFVVGDDDQSIYRFQGASEDNMLDFDKKYGKDLALVILTRNYRSIQPILDISKQLIGRNTTRLIHKKSGLTKDLVSSNNKISHLTNQPLIREYDTERDEMISIVSQVSQLLTSGISPGKIAVIYKENRYGQELLSYFKLKRLPVYNKRSTNLLEDPLIGQLLLVLRYLASAHEYEVPFNGDEMLFEILHAEWFHIPAIEIATLAAELADKRGSGGKNSLRKALSEKAARPAKDLFSQQSPLQSAGQILESLVTAVSNHTLQSLFEKIYTETGLLEFIMENPDKRRMLELLTSFFDFVKEETRRQPSMSLQELVIHLDLMDKEGISLPMVEVNGNADAVNLLTAHGSKGLEFSYVFLAGCNSHYWENKKAPMVGYYFPDTLFQSKSNEDEELRRLFYVAITRAETHLYLSYSRYRNNGKEAESSQFIEEIRSDFNMPVEKMILSSQDTVDFQYLLLRGEQAPEMERAESEFIHRVLEKFRMNVTALNNYLRCPLEFYFKNLVRIPSPKNENTEFGSAVHDALEKFFRKMQDSGNRFPEPGFLTGSFDYYMHHHRESFTRTEFARRMEYGHIILPAYYEKYIQSWNKIVAVELNINNVVIQGVPMKGKLDKLEFDGKQANVVDYKTGNSENAKSKLKGPDEKDPLGGDYWRQAVFYKLLVDHYGKGWQVISVEFDFIEPDNKKNYKKQKIYITPQDEALVSRQITETWAKIQNHDFYTGCGKEDCHWCNFVKTNKLDITAQLMEEEEHQSL
jgi:DNA helicase II / ATP-dependent DNA helicase PcrA